MQRIAQALETLNDRIGRAVAWLTLGMVLLTFAIVVLRRGFGLGWVGMQEAVVYLHALVFMLGAAYALRHDAHVRVDIFYNRLGPRGRAVVELAGTLVLLLPLTGFLAWASFDYVLASWAAREGSSEAGGLPGLFVLKSVLLLLPALLLLAGGARALRALAVLRGEPGAAQRLFGTGGEDRRP